MLLRRSDNFDADLPAGRVRVVGRPGAALGEPQGNRAWLKRDEAELVRCAATRQDAGDQLAPM